MENRRTDNLPVTDESLARVRDEIAEAYSHPSHETDSLIAAIDAGNMANAIAREKEIDALRSQRDALAEALRFCVKALEVEAPIYRAHIDEARAALALADGAE